MPPHNNKIEKMSWVRLICRFKVRNEEEMKGITILTLIDDDSMR
jgi:hypothetical protein